MSRPVGLVAADEIDVKTATGCNPMTFMKWQNTEMAMRQDCKHFQSRTYPSGDTMRKCGLDLAPEAPWNCPSDCKGYERRMADVNWRHGSLVTPPTPDAPESVGEDASIGALLDEAEDIINSAVPEVKAAVEADAERKRSKSKPKWWPFGKK